MKKQKTILKNGLKPLFFDDLFQKEENITFEIIFFLKILILKSICDTLSQKPRAISFPRKRCNYQSVHSAGIEPS